MRYATHIFIVVFVCLILFNSSIKAQNNPYKIKDELYGYFLRTEEMLKSDAGLKMTDTLFVRAKTIGDTKAQCIALYLRAKHYHQNKDYNKNKEQFEKSARFILKTPYLQYYFGMWTDIITDFINTNQHVKAISELKEFREEATRRKNDYAIIESYIMQGNLYFKKEHFRLALPYYKDALNYATKSKYQDLLGIYFNLSRCTFQLRRWKDADFYADKAMKLAITNYDRLKIYAQKLSIHCCSGEENPVEIESIFSKLQEAKSKLPNQSDDLFIYEEAIYYYYKYFKHDEAKLRDIPTNKFIPSQLVEAMSMAKHYEALNDYKNSARYYMEYTDLMKDINIEDERFLYEGFVPQLEYNRLEHEKRLLMEKRAQLELKQINDQRSLMGLNEERDNANIIIRKHEQNILQSRLEAQKAALEQQDRLLTNEQLKAEQEKKTSELIAEKNNWQLFFVCTFAIAMFISLIIFIANKLKTHQRLRRDKENAKKSERLKSLFFQNMNHEIRTPLNAISGFNEILNGDMSGDLTTEEKTNLINMITTNSELLMTLVNDVLDLSTFESGTYQMKLADTDISQLCQTAIESIRGREMNGVTLRFSPPSNKHYMLKTDAQRLQQVLTNYLSNACKYTEQGSITLTYEILPYLVRFSVTDTGSGIKEEDAHKVFNRFQMLNGKKSGTGLGLHICQLIANLLGGHVFVDTNYTQGAKFVFDHPILTLIIGFLMITMPTLDVTARNNPQYINDNLYTYYQRIKKENNPDVAASMSDKMLLKARKIKDTKAQCLAMAAKINNLIISNKQDSVPTIFKTCKNLCLKTKNYDILFNAWEDVIVLLIQKNDFEKALNELKSMQVVALNVKSKHGLTTYFYLAGNYYAMQRQFAAALTYYLQIRDYEYKDQNSLYSMIGQCHYYLRNYKEAIKSMQIALNSSHTDGERLTALVILEKSYCLLGDTIAATETINRLRGIDLEGRSESKTANYHSAFYYYYTYINIDKQKALDEEKGAFGAESGRYKYDNGEFLDANNLLKKEAKDYDKWMESDFLPTHELYISKFDFQRATKEKDLLAISTVNIKINEAKNKQKLIALQREKTAWMLKQENTIAKQKEWQLALQHIQLMKRKSELEKQKILNEAISKQKEAMQQSAKWKMSAITFVIILIFAGVSSYIIDLKRKEARLRREALAAQEEEKEKTLFFDNMNKEIRLPLDSIIELNNKLNGNNHVDFSQEERIQMVKQLNSSSSYLTGFVNDVLDISKMESGTWDANYTDCEINELCHHIISNLQKKTSNDCDIIFLPQQTVNHHPQEIHFETDINLISLTLTGFLQNALHCTKSKSISLAYSADDEVVSFSVTYLGDKITAEQATNSFYFEKNNLFDKKDAINFHKIRLIADILHAKTYMICTEGNQIQAVFEMPRSIRK